MTALMIRTRRDRTSEGGARDNTRGLVSGKALVTGPAQAGPVQLFKAFLRSFCVAASCALTPIAAFAEPLTLPSGQPFAPVDILWEAPAGETVLVIRLLTPEIARSGAARSYDSVEADFEAVCAALGLPVISVTGEDITQILVVMMDRIVTRGIPDPEATQFIGEFSVDENRCILEFF